MPCGIGQYQRHGYRTVNPDHVKISPFTGKEDWQVWISRFEAIGMRYGWDYDTRIDQLLPRLEGQAAQFVFTQLPQDVMHNYNLLIGELNSRFRVIETAKSFASKFAHRYQRQGESVEEYAANLRELYDRAHARRDKKTRDEDLVRRFLDGLRDEEARFEIEFHKDPSTLDEAVYYAVTFSEVRKSQDSERRRKLARVVRED